MQRAGKCVCPLRWLFPGPSCSLSFLARSLALCYLCPDVFPPRARPGDGLEIFCAGPHPLSRAPARATRSASRRPESERPNPYTTNPKHQTLNPNQGPCACHTICITDDGKCYTFGRNELGQLGHGDKMNRGSPTLVKTLENVRVTKAVAGKSHTLFLTSGGEVWVCGSNKYGELGQVLLFAYYVFSY